MRVPHAARLPHVQEPAAKPDVARHEALARDILEIHSDFLMAVYGYRKVHAQLLAQGWDPAEVGRDQVMNIMRGLGIRGVRRGKTPVATKPAKGTDGRPDLMDRKFEAGAPNRPHVATSPTCAWPTGASRIPHSSPTCSSGGSWAGRASPVLLQCLFDRFGSVFP